MATKEQPARKSSVEIYVPSKCRCGKLLPEEIRDQELKEVKSSMTTG